MPNAIYVRYVDGCEQAFEVDEEIDRIAIGDMVDGRFVPSEINGG